MTFIGTKKLGFTEEEVGEMTTRKFFRLYQQYKNEFDKEMMMKATTTTYEQLEYEPTINDLIPF